MAASLRKMGVYLGLVEDDDTYADEYDTAAPAALDSRRPAPANRSHEPARSERDAQRDLRRDGRAREWAPEPAGYGYDERTDRGEYGYETEYDTEEYYERDRVEQPSYRITTLHPRTYNEAVTIGEHFRSGTPVIMNLSEMQDSDAKRLVDFAAGLTFGLHGRVERVTAKVFLLSPQNVTVTAQEKARLVEGGFFNQS